MGTSELPPGDDLASPRESDEAKTRRVVHEAVDLAHARASAAACRVVDSAKVKAWIDSIGTDHQLLVPYSGR